MLGNPSHTIGPKKIGRRVWFHVSTFRGWPHVFRKGKYRTSAITKAKARHTPAAFMNSEQTSPANVKPAETKSATESARLAAINSTPSAVIANANVTHFVSENARGVIQSDGSVFR